MCLRNQLDTKLLYQKSKFYVINIFCNLFSFIKLFSQHENVHLFHNVKPMTSSIIAKM